MKRLRVLLVLLLVFLCCCNANAVTIEEIGQEYKVLSIDGELYIPLPSAFAELYAGLYIDQVAPTEQWIQISKVDSDCSAAYRQLRKYDAMEYETSAMLEDAFALIENLGIYREYTDYLPHEMGYSGGYKLLATAQKDGKAVCVITVFDDEAVYLIECGVKGASGDYFYYNSYAYGLFLSIVMPEYYYMSGK